jgi:hypothetical protein
MEWSSAPALTVGQRSAYEIIATEDLADWAGAIFEPGAVPAFVVDRADPFCRCADVGRMALVSQTGHCNVEIR